MNEDLSSNTIQGKWYLFSTESQFTSNFGTTTTIDTIDRKDYYFDFRSDMSFLSTADGTGTYEVTKDSLFISFRLRENEPFEMFRTKYLISGEVLKLVNGPATTNMKRL